MPYITHTHIHNNHAIDRPISTAFYWMVHKRGEHDTSTNKNRPSYQMNHSVQKNCFIRSGIKKETDWTEKSPTTTTKSKYESDQRHHGTFSIRPIQGWTHQQTNNVINLWPFNATCTKSNSIQSTRWPKIIACDVLIKCIIII